MCSAGELDLTASRNSSSGQRLKSLAEHSFIDACSRSCIFGSDLSNNRMDSDIGSKQPISIVLKHTPQFRWGEFDDDDLSRIGLEGKETEKCVGKPVAELSPSPQVTESGSDADNLKCEEAFELEDEQSNTCAHSHFVLKVLEKCGERSKNKHDDRTYSVLKTVDKRSNSWQATGKSNSCVVMKLPEDPVESVPLHSSAVRVAYLDAEVDDPEQRRGNPGKTLAEDCPVRFYARMQSRELSTVNEHEKNSTCTSCQSKSAGASFESPVVAGRRPNTKELGGDEVDTDMGKPFSLLLSDGQQDVVENKERFRRQLWCFLFENLNRAIDELYFLCELECDSEQMDEGLLVLAEAGLDFQELKARAEAFEKVGRGSRVPGNVWTVSSSRLSESEHQRPHAVAWEVRRMASSPRHAEIFSSSLRAFKRAQMERDEGNDDNRDNMKDATLTFAYDGDMPPLKQGSMAIRGLAGRRLLNVDATGPEMKVRNMSRELEEPCPDDISVHHAGCLASVPGASLASTSDVLDEQTHRSPNMTSPGLTTDSIYSDSNEMDALNFDERRYAIEAWNEKRNWEDILKSPLRGSTCSSRSPTGRNALQRVRVLHDKLMSPEKMKKSPLETKKQVDEKQARAKKLRLELENERVQRLQRTTKKQSRVSDWQAVRSRRLREGMDARQQRGESRHEAHIAQIARRASAESSKVSEVRFITSLNEENRKLSLQQKLEDSELRRAERLQSIRTKQREDLAKEEAALERRKLLEAERIQRIADAQRKKDEATARREEERKAASAAREARTMEQVRKKEVRAKAQQEETILLRLKLAEKLRESSARRKFYLEQIRERAGTETDKSEKRKDILCDNPSWKFKDRDLLLPRQSFVGALGVSCHFVDNHMTVLRDADSGNVIGSKASNIVAAGDLDSSGTTQQVMRKRVKRLRQRLAARKFELAEPPSGVEGAGVGSSSVIISARSRIGRWLQDLERHQQTRNIGILSVIEEIVKYLDGKEAELDAARQSALLDFVATALPASRSTKLDISKCIIALLHLLIVLISIPANRSYFIARNLLPPLLPMLSTALENFCNVGYPTGATSGSGISLGGLNDYSVERSVMDKKLEVTKEILEGLLLALTAIIGHPCKDERLQLMQDDLVELIVGCEVIHQLCNLFALFDRPQVEGAPIPAAVLLGLKLLETLTGRRAGSSSHSPETSACLSFHATEEVAGVRKSMLHHPARKPSLVTGEVTGFNKVIINPECSACLYAGDEKSCSSAMSPDMDNEDNMLQHRRKGQQNQAPDSADYIVDETFKGKIAPKREVCPKIDSSLTDYRDISQDAAFGHKPQADSSFRGASIPEHHTDTAPNRCVRLLLAVALETGLIGLTSLLTAVLLQANPRSSPMQAALALPSNFDEVATSILSILNNLARLDLSLIQNMLATPDLRVEFFHLTSFLLSYCTCKWKSATDQVASLLLETLLLLGYFALLHPDNQDVLRWGKGPTILHKICELPFAFFSDSRLTPVLNGTLLAACYGSDRNRDVVLQELSLKPVVSFLQSTSEVVTTGLQAASIQSSEASEVCQKQIGDSDAIMLTLEDVEESSISEDHRSAMNPDEGFGSEWQVPGMGSSTRKQLTEAAESARKPLGSAFKPSCQSGDGDSIEVTSRDSHFNTTLSKGPASWPSAELRDSLFPSMYVRESLGVPFTRNKGVSLLVSEGYSKFSEVYTPVTSRLCMSTDVSSVNSEAGKASSTDWKTSKFFLLENRFPRSLWNHAEEFFSIEL